MELLSVFRCYLDVTLRSGTRFNMKYHILHDFGMSTSYKEKSSDRFKELYNLKLLTNFNVNLMSLPEIYICS